MSRVVWLLALAGLAGSQISKEVAVTANPFVGSWNANMSKSRPHPDFKFQRVTLQPGASCRLTFTVPVAQLGFYDRDLAYVVEPGAVEIFVGTSARELTHAGTVTVTATELPPAKAFDGSVLVSPL